MWHSENRTTMYVASVDIKMVFDVPRPTPTANNMGDQEVHGWITAASSREMAGLEGQATFEHVHGSRQVARCLRQQSAEAPRLWLTMTMRIL